MDAEWTPVGSIAEVPEGRPVRTIAGADDLLLYRTGERILAVSNRCTHQGAPLHRGAVHEAGSLITVSCPVHGSTFQLTDGRVMRGPAMSPLPAYEVRVNGGAVEVRPRPS
jgi:nitrite reductase/ring-hydroxylating ferredoxin subunit